jgi:hypothetical protein
MAEQGSVGVDVWDCAASGLVRVCSVSRAVVVICPLLYMNFIIYYLGEEQNKSNKMPMV